MLTGACRRASFYMTRRAGLLQFFVVAFEFHRLQRKIIHPLEERDWGCPPSVCRCLQQARDGNLLLPSPRLRSLRGASAERVSRRVLETAVGQDRRSPAGVRPGQPILV